MAKTKIEWTDWTWNPVWGCNNGCSFCYARKIANRFGKSLFGLRYKSFEKPFWTGREIPKKPQRVFVDSMSDPCCWTYEWIDKVCETMAENPYHTFQILTKRPECYLKFVDLPNVWYGVSVTNKKDLTRIGRLVEHTGKINTFISFEPILDNDFDASILTAGWLIIGLETGRKNVFIPPVETIYELVELCRIFDVPMFMKPSMSKVWPEKLIQEFPDNG